MRVANDFYPTPAKLTHILFDNVPHLPSLFFEPCAGDGAMATELAYYGTAHSSDLAGDTSHPRDATTREFWGHWTNPSIGLSANWATVTNPPFNRAAEILPLAYEYSPWGCAFLLRLTYLEPTKNRAKWLQEYSDNLRFLIPVNPRPRFVKGGNTDSATVAWFVWQKSWSWSGIGIKCPFIFCDNWEKL
jgi:hypothetical protein